MVRRCTVQGCNRDKEISWKSYGVPAIRKNEEAITTRRQNLWLKRLNLFGKKISIKTVWVCDAHFLSGKPSYYMDEKDPDWAPSQNIDSISFVSKSVYERYKRRKKFQAMRVTAKTPECLLKQKTSYSVCHQASGVPNPSIHASSNKHGCLSKEIEMKKKITHQLPGVSKKQEELLEVLKNQSNIVWMNKIPVENSIQMCFGENVKLLNIHPPNVVQALKPNGKKPEAPGERIENERNGVDQEQMVRNNCILFISRNTTHDHDYCAKPIFVNDPSDSAVEERSPIDHDYCRIPSLYGQPSTVESDWNSLHIPPPEEVNIDDGRETGGESRLESTATIDADFILPDIPREDNGSMCNRCSEGVSHLKLDLERKSATLEHRLNDLNSLKQELKLAREHIDNLRAQLGETTDNLCSYFSKDRKSS